MKFNKSLRIRNVGTREDKHMFMLRLGGLSDQLHLRLKPDQNKYPITAKSIAAAAYACAYLNVSLM